MNTDDKARLAAYDARAEEAASEEVAVFNSATDPALSPIKAHRDYDYATDGGTREPDIADAGETGEALPFNVVENLEQPNPNDDPDAD